MADYSDDFERADSTDLGASWSPNEGTGLRIVSGKVKPQDSQTEGGETNSTSLTSDQYCEITVTYGTIAAALKYPAAFLNVTGADSTRNGYQMTLGLRDGDWYLERTTNGATGTTIASGTTSVPASPFTMRIERSGNSVIGKINGSTMGSGSDTTYTSGGIGIYMYDEDPVNPAEITQVAFGDTSGGSSGQLLKQLLIQQ